MTLGVAKSNWQAGVWLQHKRLPPNWWVMGEDPDRLFGLRIQHPLVLCADENWYQKGTIQCVSKIR